MSNNYRRSPRACRSNSWDEHHPSTSITKFIGPYSHRSGTQPLPRVLFGSPCSRVPVIWLCDVHPELLINDQTGLIYSDPFNATNLAQRVKQALVMDDDVPCGRHYITVTKNFTPDQVCNYLNVYQTLSNKG